MDEIKKIRTEIERRLQREREVKDKYDSNTSSFVEGSIDALEGLLSFLSTLEPEKPMNLDEEIDNYFKHWTEDEYTGAACHYQYANLNDCRGIARHFAQWGAEHAKDESEKPLGLEEEIHKYNEERFDEYFPEQDGDFISEVDFMTCLDRVARHFAEWGAEHLKK